MNAEWLSLKFECQVDILIIHIRLNPTALPIKTLKPSRNKWRLFLLAITLEVLLIFLFISDGRNHFHNLPDSALTILITKPK